MLGHSLMNLKLVVSIVKIYIKKSEIAGICWNKYSNVN